MPHILTRLLLLILTFCFSSFADPSTAEPPSNKNRLVRIKGLGEFVSDISHAERKKISSKSGEIFSPEHITSGSFRKTEDHLGGAPRGPHAMGARPGVGPRPARVWRPWLAPDAHPSPIYSPRRKNNKKRRSSMKSSVAAVIVNLRSGEF